MGVPRRHIRAPFLLAHRVPHTRISTMQATSGSATSHITGHRLFSHSTRITAFRSTLHTHQSSPISTAPAHWPAAQPLQLLRRRQGAKAAQAAMDTRLRAQAQQAPVMTEAGGRKTGVLFVCLGNICRSPSAEAMFRAVVEREGLAGAFDIDSCGTGGGARDWYKPGGYSYHEGDAADARMSAAAKQRGVFLTSRSRPLKPEDLTRWNYIIGMDEANTAAILRASEFWVGNSNGKQALPEFEQVRAKTSLMTDYCTKYSDATHVPDPYYGGPAGFEKVLDLLDDACSGLLAHIQARQQAEA